MFTVTVFLLCPCTIKEGHYTLEFVNCSKVADEIADAVLLTVNERKIESEFTIPHIGGTNDSLLADS